MTNLKTLKDFDFTLVDENGEYEGLKTELREEAIKWVKDYEKEIKEHQKNNEYICQITRIIDWIRHFFNITEDELR